MHTESLATRETSGDRLGSGLRTSEPMTRTEHRFVMQQQSGMHVPAEFGNCEIVDKRNAFEKAGDFVSAAAHRAGDSTGWKKWFDDEQQKFVGIGEGLNVAKEETKHMAVGATRAVADGRAWNAVMHTPDYLRAAADGGMHVLGAMARDAHAVDRFASSVAVSVGKANDSYSHMHPRDQGKVIGQVMFAMVNPEGSTEGASVTMQAADRIATHVDAAVVSGIQKSMRAIEHMQQATPELVAQAKEMLREYAQSLHLGPQELEYAGVPRGYFSPSKAVESHGDFYAMSKKDPLENWKSPDEVYRGDNKAFSSIDQKGRRKSHINMFGDLCPANPQGVYKGEEITAAHHLDGHWNRGAKTNSPFTSFSVVGDVAKFGSDHKITVDLKALRAAIECGEVRGVKILELPEILDDINRSEKFSETAKVKLRARAIRDNEVLIKGVIPGKFLKVEP